MVVCKQSSACSDVAQSINRKGFRELALLTKGTSDPAFGRNYVCMNPGVYMLKVTQGAVAEWVW